MGKHQDIVRQRVAEIYRADSRRVLSTLIRLLGDFDLAEDALQEAFQVAIERWPQEGLPQNPFAWLVSTGRFKGIDAIRRQRRGEEILAEVASEDTGLGTSPSDIEAIRDDELRLIFTCCHPSIPQEGRIALALREVCGLGTQEIARGFLAKPATMTRRITRAKERIRRERIPYEVPSKEKLGERLNVVLQVVYLVYNEGYDATLGDNLMRPDLAEQALTIGRLIAQLVPEPESIGLLALMLLHESRRPARIDGNGDVIPLEEQNRSLWDRKLIAEGALLVQQAMMSGKLGFYTLQAAIAAVHAAAPSVESTSWVQVTALYDMLTQLTPSPVVRLNRAIAVAMRDGPQAGLDRMSDLLQEGDLVNYHPFYAALGDLNRRLGRTDKALYFFRQALKLARLEPERRFLSRRIEELSR